MVNSHGDVVMGFSGSSLVDPIGAFDTGRRGGQSTFIAPVTLQAGSGTYGGAWGDYSATSLDPNDSLSIWTIQEYFGIGGTHLKIVQVSGY